MAEQNYHELVATHQECDNVHCKTMEIYFRQDGEIMVKAECSRCGRLVYLFTSFEEVVAYSASLDAGVFYIPSQGGSA